MTDRKIELPAPKISPVKPKSIPIRCPVCNGFGTLKHGTLICHGCKGKGYILVPAEEVKDERLSST